MHSFKVEKFYFLYNDIKYLNKEKGIKYIIPIYKSNIYAVILLSSY